jgi:hypothetical protein
MTASEGTVLEQAQQPTHTSDSKGKGIDGVLAVVLTFRRPRLATSVVRGLIDVEGFPPDRILLVVNGEGGLDDADLEAKVTVLRLPENVGPAGGFSAGLSEGAKDSGIRWIYLCEDDVGLFDIPAPRVARLVADAEQLERLEPSRPIGAVVAYGRNLRRLTGATTPHEVHGKPTGYDDVDAAAWGASLISRRVPDRGILPDPRYFIDFEDFDFFFRLRSSGFRLMVDRDAAHAVAQYTLTSAGRDTGIQQQRPVDRQEPWRAYYVARNFFFLARSHGTPVWLATHLLYTIRRLQLASSWTERRNILIGTWDGVRHRGGKNRAFERTIGEF